MTLLKVKQTIVAGLMMGLVVPPAFAQQDAGASGQVQKFWVGQNDSSYQSYRLPQDPKNYGKLLTVDTRDQEQCLEIKKSLAEGKSLVNLDDLCRPDDQRPYATLVIGPEEWSKTVFKFNETGVRQSNAFLKSMFIGAVGITHYKLKSHSRTWNYPIDEIPQHYWNNVTQAPHWDHDKFTTNYVEHPLVGSIYYQLARHSGSSALESLGFAAIVSTFMWEYGYEAAYQRPSINDMIVTPLIGSLIGEVFYQLFQSIERNDGRVLGSRALGTFVKVVTNSGYYITKILNKVIGNDTFKDGEMRLAVQNVNPDRQGGEGLYGPHPYPVKALLLQIKLKFR